MPRAPASLRHWPGPRVHSVPSPLPDSPAVIRREQFARLGLARDVLAEAKAEAEAILSRARDDAEAECRRGRDEGLQAGQLEAARQLAGAVQDVDAFIQAREAELAELVFAVAFKLIGELPDAERSARLVGTAIADYRSDIAMTLRTDLAGAAFVRHVVEQLGVGDRVHVEGSIAQQPGSCTLVHARGQAPIGLLDQFRALMAGSSETEPTNVQP